MVNKLLFYILFGVLLIFNAYLYRTLIYDFLNLTSIPYIFVILLYIFVILPITAYLSEKMITFSLNQKKVNGRALSITFIMIPILIIGMVLHNEFKEKSLSQAIDFDQDDFELLIFHPRSSFQFHTDQVDAADELIEFLDQYKVKRIRERDWDFNFSDEKAISFDLLIDDGAIMADIMEERLRINQKPYILTNGPVDIDWIERFANGILDN